MSVTPENQRGISTQDQERIKAIENVYQAHEAHRVFVSRSKRLSSFADRLESEISLMEEDLERISSSSGEDFITRLDAYKERLFRAEQLLVELSARAKSEQEELGSRVSEPEPEPELADLVTEEVGDSARGDVAVAEQKPLEQGVVVTEDGRRFNVEDDTEFKTLLVSEIEIRFKRINPLFGLGEISYWMKYPKEARAQLFEENGPLSELRVRELQDIVSEAFPDGHIPGLGNQEESRITNLIINQPGKGSYVGIFGYYYVDPSDVVKFKESLYRYKELFDSGYIQSLRDTSARIKQIDSRFTLDIFFLKDLPPEKRSELFQEGGPLTDTAIYSVLSIINEIFPNGQIPIDKKGDNVEQIQVKPGIHEARLGSFAILYVYPSSLDGLREELLRLKEENNTGEQEIEELEREIDVSQADIKEAVEGINPELLALFDSADSVYDGVDSRLKVDRSADGWRSYVDPTKSSELTEEGGIFSESFARRIIDMITEVFDSEPYVDNEIEHIYIRPQTDSASQGDTLFVNGFDKPEDIKKVLEDRKTQIATQTAQENHKGEIVSVLDFTEQKLQNEVDPRIHIDRSWWKDLSSDEKKYLTEQEGLDTYSAEIIIYDIKTILGEKDFVTNIIFRGNEPIEIVDTDLYIDPTAIYDAKVLRQVLQEAQRRRSSVVEVSERDSLKDLSIEEYRTLGFTIEKIDASIDPNVVQSLIEFMQLEGKEVYLVDGEWLVSRDSQKEQDQESAEPEADSESTESITEEITHEDLAKQILSKISQVQEADGTSRAYIDPNNIEEVRMLLARFRKLSSEKPDLREINIGEERLNIKNFELDILEQLFNAQQEVAQKKAEERGVAFKNLKEAIRENLLDVDLESDQRLFYPKKGYEFVDPSDAYNFAVKKKSLKDRVASKFSRKEELGKTKPEITLPEVPDEEVPKASDNTETSVEVKRTPEQRIAQIEQQFSIPSVSFSDLKKYGFTFHDYANVFHNGSVNGQAVDQLAQVCRRTQDGGSFVVFDPEAKIYATKSLCFKSPEQLAQDGLSPLYRDTVLDRNKILRLHIVHGDTFEFTPDGRVWSSKAQLYNGVEDFRRSEGNLPPAEVDNEMDEKEVDIIDIRDKVLFDIIGEQNLANLLQSLADPTASASAEEYIKFIFRKEGVDQQKLKAEIYKNGYTEINDFLNFWEEGNGYQETLQSLQLMLAQEESNVLQEMKRFYHGGLTKFWERTKNALITSGPVVVAVSAVAVGGAAYGVSKAITRGIYGFITGWVATDRGTQVGKEKMKKRAEETQDKIQAKEDEVLGELRGTPEFREALLKRFGIVVDPSTNGARGADNVMLQHLSVFFSDGLRTASYRATMTDTESPIIKNDNKLSSKTTKDDARRANALLLYQTGKQEIARDSSARVARGEISRERAQTARLESLVSELYSDDTVDVVSSIIRDNPQLLKVVQKVLSIKRGDMNKVFGDGVVAHKQNKEEVDRLDEFSKRMLGGIAGASVGVATSFSDELRAVALATAGAYLGAHLGNMSDIKKREEVLRVEVTKRIRDAESAVASIEESGITDFDILRNFAKDIRVATSLGLLKNNAVLEIRARNVLRAIEYEMFEKELRHKGAEKLLSELDVELGTLKADRQTTIDTLKDQGGVIKRNLNMIRGGVSGALIGGAAGYFGADALHWLGEKFHVGENVAQINTSDTQQNTMFASAETTHHASDLALHSSASSDIENNLPATEMVDLPSEHDLWNIDRLKLIEEFELSTDAVKQMDAWIEKYPSLGSGISMREILEAATDPDGSGHKTLFPETNFSDPDNAMLHYDRERDLEMFGQMLRTGNKEDALAFLQNQDFNRVSLSKLFPDGIPKDVPGALRDFVNQYETEVANMQVGERNGDLIERLGRALQHDANRDDYQVDNARLFPNQQGGVTPLGRESGRPIVYMGTANESGSNNHLVVSGAKNIGGGDRYVPTPEDLQKATDAEAQIDAFSKKQNIGLAAPVEQKGDIVELKLGDPERHSTFVAKIAGVFSTDLTPDGTGLEINPVDAEPFTISWTELAIISATLGGVIGASVLFKAKRDRTGANAKKSKMLRSVSDPLAFVQHQKIRTEAPVRETSGGGGGGNPGARLEADATKKVVQVSSGGGAPAEQPKPVDSATPEVVKTDPAKEKTPAPEKKSKSPEVQPASDVEPVVLDEDSDGDDSVEPGKDNAKKIIKTKEGFDYGDIGSYGKVGVKTKGDIIRFDTDNVNMESKSIEEILCRDGKKLIGITRPGMSDQLFDTFMKRLAALELMRRSLGSVDNAQKVVGAIKKEVSKMLTNLEPKDRSGILSVLNDRTVEGLELGDFKKKDVGAGVKKETISKRDAPAKSNKASSTVPSARGETVKKVPPRKTSGTDAKNGGVGRTKKI